MTTSYTQVLDMYLASPDFKKGVTASTRAYWDGSGYSVELFEDGTWHNLWDNQTGNLYETPGVILHLPTLDDSDYQECVNVVENPMSEEDYFAMAFANDEKELAESMRDALKEKDHL